MWFVFFVKCPRSAAAMCSSQNVFFLETVSVCKRSLFSVWRSENNSRKRCSALENYIYSNAIEKSKCTEEEHGLIAESIQNFCKRLSVMWKECHRVWKIFNQKYKVWFDEDLGLLKQNTHTGSGRKQKNFADCSAKRQVTKVSELVNGKTCNELMTATRVSLCKAGKRSASQIVSMAVTDSTASSKIKKSLESDRQVPIKYTPDEALAKTYKLFYVLSYYYTCSLANSR